MKLSSVGFFWKTLISMLSISLSAIKYQETESFESNKNFSPRTLLSFAVVQLVKEVFISGLHIMYNDINVSNFLHKFMDITHFFLLNFGWIRYCSRHDFQPIIRNVSNMFEFTDSFYVHRDNVNVSLH